MKRPAWVTMGLLGIALFTTSGRAEETPGLLRFKVNLSESKITASVAEPMAMIRGSATGTFRIVSGEVQGNPATVDETGGVKMVIDAASYKTDSDSRDKDVIENALEAPKYPTITFESAGLSGVRRDGVNAGQLLVLGKLTLHGVTKDIAVPVTVVLDGNGRLVTDGTYSFKFEDYGVKRPSKMMGLMTTGDEAKIDFHIVADPV